MQYPHDARVADSTVHSYVLLNHMISRLSVVDGQLMTATGTFDTFQKVKACKVQISSKTKEDVEHKNQ